MRIRASLRLIAAAVAAAACVVGSTPLAHAEDLPRYHPSRLAHVDGAAQVIVVTAPRWRTTHATLRAYERDGDGGWREVVGATPARLGWSGLYRADERRQGSGRTPAGTFGLEWAFGRKPDPGTRLRYVRIDRDDAWTYNPDSPRTYNVFQDAPVPWSGFGSYVERLWSYGPQYDYVAVMDYNLPAGPIRRGPDGVRRVARPADTDAGGGIFLHVTNGKSTAGCIAIPRAAMRGILQWLDPDKDPVIVVGPESVIDRM